MTYEEYDLSVDSGRPVELYEFKRGLNYYRYTTASETVSKGGADFIPEYISRDKITETDEVNQADLKITFSLENEFAGEYVAYAPEEVTTLTIYRGHTNDPDGEFIVIWKGRVLSCGVDEKEIELTCESVFSSIQRVGLRARYELICRHALYSSGCTLSMSSYRTAGTVAGESGMTITVAAAAGQADGYYTAGIVENADGAYRFITKHVGSVLTLSRTFSESINGQAVSIYPGCDKAKATCISKFDNLPNFGGFPYIPTDNPFVGSVV